MEYRILDWNGVSDSHDGFPGCRTIYKGNDEYLANFVFDVLKKNFDGGYFGFKLEKIEDKPPEFSYTEDSIIEWYRKIGNDSYYFVR